jgi:Tfp pilus assembly protein FimT
MRRSDKGFSIVDVLIIIAILLIVVGMVGPKLAHKDSKTKRSSAPISATVRPAR